MDPTTTTDTAGLAAVRDRLRVALEHQTRGLVDALEVNLEQAHAIAALSASYWRLGGDLELNAIAEPLEAELRVAELEQGIDRVLDTIHHDRTLGDLLTEGRLDDLGQALRNLEAVR